MKKTIAMILTLCLALGCVPALAENIKHERVYVVAAPDGAVQSLTDSVRLENGDGLDELRDQTMLENIVNVSGDEAFALDGETLTWQAAGNDITYQGTSDEPIAVTPVVTITLDGESAAAADLKDAEGDVTLTVSYETAKGAPALAVTVLPLPKEGITNLTYENAFVLNEMDMRALVGWGVPGADEQLNLPASFTASFHADHADLGWMMTLASTDPIAAACEAIDGRVEIDAQAELDELVSVLTALRDGETLPETTGKTKDVVPMITELNEGLAALDDAAVSLKDGAKELSDGAASLDTGAASVKAGAGDLATGAASLSTGAAEAETGAAALDTGLATLSANNETLNEGAKAIFDAILATANAQIASSGLSEAGITLPELTRENYAEALDTALAALTPEALQTQARAQAETAVRAQVQANEAQVRAAVEEQARAKVLEGVLKAVGMKMTAEAYAQALAGGQVSDEQAGTVSAAVDDQMASDAVKAQIDEAVSAQIEQLVSENTDKALESDPTIAAAMAQADAARESLTSLKAQLDQVNTFVTGLETYTQGVSDAASGAAALHTGLTQLSAGAATLSTGAATLSTGATTLADGAAALNKGASTLSTGAASLRTDGTLAIREKLTGAEKQAAEKLLPYLTGDAQRAITLFEETRDNTKDSGYDLRNEDMKGVTVYIIRTDLQ